MWAGPRDDADKVSCLATLEHYLASTLTAVMGKTCIAFGCSNSHQKGFSLFKFPVDERLRKSSGKLGLFKSKELVESGKDQLRILQCVLNILQKTAFNQFQ